MLACKLQRTTVAQALDHHDMYVSLRKMGVLGYRSLQKITDVCLKEIWNVERSWCLGDGGAYLTMDCLNAYGEFLEIGKEDTVNLAKVFDNVHVYCTDEITEVCSSLYFILYSLKRTSVKDCLGQYYSRVATPEVQLCVYRASTILDNNTYQGWITSEPCRA